MKKLTKNKPKSRLTGIFLLFKCQRSGIDAVVDKNNGPYVIMVWSKHDSQHFKELRDTLMNKNSVSCRPIAVLNMEKSLCFESVCIAENSTSIEWKLKDDGMNIIEKNLKSQLSKMDSFMTCLWYQTFKNGVNLKSAELVDIKPHDTADFLCLYFMLKNRSYLCF